MDLPSSMLYKATSVIGVFVKAQKAKKTLSSIPLTRQDKAKQVHHALEQNQSRVDLSGFGGKTNGYQNPVAYQYKSILFNLGISMALPVKYGGFNPYQWLAVIMGRTSLINGQTRIKTIETLSAESLFVHLWCMSPTDDAPAEKGKTWSKTILETEWVWCAILERYLCIWIMFARRWQRNCFLLVVILWTCLWLFNTTNHRW